MVNVNNGTPVEPPFSEPARTEAPAQAPTPAYAPVAPAPYVVNEQDRKNRRTLIAGLGAIAILFVVFSAGVVAGTAVGNHHHEHGYSHVLPGNGYGGGQNQYGYSNQVAPNGRNTTGGGNLKHPVANGVNPRSQGAPVTPGSSSTPPASTK